VAAGGEQGDAASLEVGRVETAFFCAGEDGNDAADLSGDLEERKQVFGEVEAGVVS
jgi:hypothetical protein